MDDLGIRNTTPGVCNKLMSMNKIQCRAMLIQTEDANVRRIQMPVLVVNAVHDNG